MAVSPGQQFAPSGPRRTVATFDEYGNAERAVDWLADKGFPVEHVSIVGSGLRYVEQVEGRVTTGRAAMAGAAQGAMLGVLFSLLFGLFFTIDGSFLGLILYGLVLGAIFGGALGAFMHAASGGRRDFASVSGTQADRYEVQVDEPHADEAQRLLAEMPAVSPGSSASMR